MDYTVIIPAYNAAATIAESIDSIKRQTIQPIETIVVDDGSSDDTVQIVKSAYPRVHIISQANAGPGSATTAGIAVASTPLIATLDADDIWLPEKMAIQIAHLESHPECRGVFCQLQSFHEEGREGEVRPGWSRTTMAIYRAEAIEVGPVIDPEGNRGDMVDWIGRARHLGMRLDMLDDVLALRRIRPGSMSYGRDDEKDKGYLRVAYMALQRKKRSEQ